MPTQVLLTNNGTYIIRSEGRYKTKWEHGEFSSMSRYKNGRRGNAHRVGAAFLWWIERGMEGRMTPRKIELWFDKIIPNRVCCLFLK